VRLLLEVEVSGGDRGELYDGSSAEQGFGQNAVCVRRRAE
jgi:hypothetical protein